MGHLSAQTAGQGSGLFLVHPPGIFSFYRVFSGATRFGNAARDWPIWLIAIVSTVIVWRTKVHLLWLLGAGAFLGWMGWV